MSIPSEKQSLYPSEYLYDYDTNKYFIDDYRLGNHLKRLVTLWQSDDKGDLQDILNEIEILKESSINSLHSYDALLQPMIRSLSTESQEEKKLETLKIVFKLIKLNIFITPPLTFSEPLFKLICTDFQLLCDSLRFIANKQTSQQKEAIKEIIRNIQAQYMSSQMLTKIFAHYLEEFDTEKFQNFLSFILLLDDAQKELLEKIFNNINPVFFQKYFHQLHLFFLKNQDRMLLTRYLTVALAASEMQNFPSSLLFSDLIESFVLYQHHFQNLDLIKKVLEDFQKLAQIVVLTKEHRYELNSFRNVHYAQRIEALEYLQNTKTIFLLLNNEALPTGVYLDRLNKIIKFIQLLEKNKNEIHSEANTLKALCFFTPRGNPKFQLSNPDTLDIVLQMMRNCQTIEKLRRILLFLDLFSPQEALKYWNHEEKKGAAITKTEFKNLSATEQLQWTEYLWQMRIRSTQIPRWILKTYHTHDATLCTYALKWLCSVKKTLPLHDREILKEMMQKHPSYPLKTAAAQSLWYTSQNPKNRDDRDLIISELLKISHNETLSEEALTYQQELSKIISHYHFNEVVDAAVLESLLNLLNDSQIIKNSKAAQLLILSFMHIISRSEIQYRQGLFYKEFLFDRILIRCLQLINSGLWKEWDREYALDGSSTHFEISLEVKHLKYPIFQHFELNRHRMTVGILDLFCHLYSGLLNIMHTEVDKVSSMRFYKKNFFKKLPENSYYVPFVHLTTDAKMFRGIGSKQGKIICQHAVLETLMMGCFSREVKRAQHDCGNWSKREDDLTGTFFTHDLESALSPLYFDSVNGALVVTTASEINQLRMGMKLRIERESSYNFICLGGKSRYTFDRILLHPSWKPDLDLIAGKTNDFSHFTETVRQYQRCQPKSKEKKKLKGLLRAILEQIQTSLKQNAQKEIFKEMSLQDILDLHRHLNDSAQMYKRLVFTTNPIQNMRFEHVSSSEIHHLTEERFYHLKMLTTHFLKHFGIPFMLGQDQVLVYTNEHFLLTLDSLIAMLSPFDERVTLCENYESLERRKECLASFTQCLQSQSQTKSLDPYFLKIFRLALFFKDAEVNSLKKLLMNSEYRLFFGFGRGYLLPVQCILDLVQLYQQCKKIKKINDSRLSKTVTIFLSMGIELEENLLHFLIKEYLDHSNINNKIY